VVGHVSPRSSEHLKCLLHPPCAMTRAVCAAIALLVIATRTNAELRRVLCQWEQSCSTLPWTKNSRRVSEVSRLCHCATSSLSVLQLTSLSLHALGMIWPRGFVAAAAFWNFNASTDPSSSTFVQSIYDLNDDLASRGSLVCPTNCSCDQVCRHTANSGSSPDLSPLTHCPMHTCACWCS